MKNYADQNLNPSEFSPFVEIDAGNRIKCVRKSTLIGLLSDNKEKLSSDRLKRVQSSNKRSVRRMLEIVDVSPQNRVLNSMNEIQIGDWCLFQNPFVDTRNEIDFMLGIILSFKYVNGRTEKDKEYSLDFAPVHHSSNSRGVEVLSTWNGIDENGKINNIEYHCSFLNIDHYFATLTRETIYADRSKNIHLSEKYLNRFKTDFESLLTQQK